MSGPSVLIVEDDPGAAETFEPMLRAHGYRARVAADADAAFQEIDREAPDVILLDLHLPRIDGVEFLRRLRAAARYRSIPTAIVTGDYMVDEQVVNALPALGATLHFKPLWEEDIVRIVVGLLGDLKPAA